MSGRISALDYEQIVRMIQDDVESTLGPKYGGMVRRLGADMLDLFNENADDERWNLEYFTERLVEDVQQYIHDSFFDTTWPRCPEHERHPLWLENKQWTCEDSGKPHATLGSLGAMTEG
jgi:hypothetical protein